MNQDLRRPCPPRVGTRAPVAIRPGEKTGAGAKRRDFWTHLVVTAAEIVFLGAGIFPAAGALPEKIWLCAVEVPCAQEAADLPGDGSPMEEGAHTEWMDLDDAISACVRGEIEDAKTELALRRLRDHHVA